MTNPFWYTFFSKIIPYPYFMLYDPGANVLVSLASLQMTSQHAIILSLFAKCVLFDFGLSHFCHIFNYT